MKEDMKKIRVGRNLISLDDDNVIYFTNIGEIDEIIAYESIRAMRTLQNMVEGNVDYIIDLNNGGKTSTRARKMLKEYTENEVKGKIAFVGLHPVSRVLASFFMSVTKKSDMRFFKTTAKAIAWLKEMSPGSMDKTPHSQIKIDGFQNA